MPDDPDHSPTIAGAKAIHPIKSRLKELGLGFVRIVGVERFDPVGRDGRPSQFTALLVFNALRGSGSSMPAFREKMRGEAVKAGHSSMLYRLPGGPVQMIDCKTGERLSRYQTMNVGIAAYFAQLARRPLELESLWKVINRTRGSRWMAGVGAQAVGEMLNVAEFTPARVSEEFRVLVERLRKDRVEMGFVSPRKSAMESMLGLLKQDVDALGMDSYELCVGKYQREVLRESQVVARPILLVVMKDRLRRLRDFLNDVAVKHRQDHVLFVYQDGAVELVNPYHDCVEQSFNDLLAGIRVYVDQQMGGMSVITISISLRDVQH